VVVFPTPPFWLVIANMFTTASSPQSCNGAGRSKNVHKAGISRRRIAWVGNEILQA